MRWSKNIGVGGRGGDNDGGWWMMFAKLETSFHLHQMKKAKVKRRDHWMAPLF